MNRNPFIGALLMILVVVVIVPTAFFIAPQRTFAQASAVNCIGSMLGFGAGGAAVSAVVSVPVSSTAILAQTTISAGATTGSCVSDTILKPLARMLARIVLQQITASTINWINGGNGSGKPSFVTNLSVNLQGVGDAVALSFIARTGTAFNSLFGSAIRSSLQLTYNQQTSQAGFFAANQSTLPGTRQSQEAFLNGNWSQGGIPAWFALTTQDQNNPYTLFQTAQSQLGSNVSQAQTNRRQDLVQSGGFLSWCGTTAAADQTQSAATAAYQQCQDTNGVNADCLSAYTNAGGTTSLSSGVKPGDSCTNGDGTPGNIQTPGSILHDYTQKAVVGAGIDQLVSAQDLDQALGAIAMALVNQVLGSTGLLGASAPSSSRPAITTQLQNYAADNSSASASATSIAQSKASQVTFYTGAWNTIAIAADTASTTAAGLATFCAAAADTAANALINSGNATEGAVFIMATPAALASTHSTFIDASRAQAVAAQTAITTLVAPVLKQALAAPSTVSATQAFVLKVETEALGLTSLTKTDTGAAGALTSDVQTLQAMPPSATDVATVQENAQAFGGARATPEGSLTVSGSSLVDQMNLITTNSNALKTTVCNPNSSLYVTYDTTYSSGG